MAQELSGEEQRAKLREEYKRELQLRKQMEQQARAQGRMNRVQAEVEKMEAALHNDDTDDWTRRLNETAAMAEAKLDMVLGGNPRAEAPAADAVPVVDTDLQGNATTPSQAAPTKTLGDAETAAVPPVPSEGASQADAPLPKPGKTLGDEGL